MHCGVSESQVGLQTFPIVLSAEIITIVHQRHMAEVMGSATLKSRGVFLTRILFPARSPYLVFQVDTLTVDGENEDVQWKKDKKSLLGSLQASSMR